MFVSRSTFIDTNLVTKFNGAEQARRAHNLIPYKDNYLEKYFLEKLFY